MQSTLTSLLSAVTSENPREQNDAIGAIGLLLERSCYPSAQDEQYVSLLPPELLTVRLSPTEQRVFVDALLALLEKTSIVGAIWALGKARREIGLKAIVTVIKRLGNASDEDTLWQMMISLENHLESSPDLDYEVLRQQNHLLRDAKIRYWIQVKTIGSERLEQIGQRLLQKIAVRDDD